MVSRRSLLCSFASSAVLVGSGCVQHPLPPLDGAIEEVRIYRRTQAGEELVAALSKSGYRVDMENVDTSAESGSSNPESEPEKQAFESLSKPSSELVHELLIRDSAADSSGTSDTHGISAYRVDGDKSTSVLPNDYVEFQINMVDSTEILGFSKVVRQGSVVETAVVGYEDGTRSDGKNITTNATISSDESRELENTYSDVQYTITVESTLSEKFSSVNVYRTSKRIYNRITAGSHSSFVLEIGNGARISALE